MDFYVGSRPFVGFRRWDLTVRSTLSAKALSFDWEAGEPTRAVCITSYATRRGPDVPRSHLAPHHDCSCGLYHWYAPKNMKIPETIEFLMDHGSNLDRAVYGASLFWGKLCLAERGVRAEYARPLALIDTNAFRSKGWKLILDRTADAYEVPIVPEEELVAYAAQYGDPLDIDDWR
jgi:hypothetical protein